MNNMSMTSMTTMQLNNKQKLREMAWVDYLRENNYHYYDGVSKEKQLVPIKKDGTEKYLVQHIGKSRGYCDQKDVESDFEMVYNEEEYLSKFLINLENKKLKKNLRKKNLRNKKDL